MTGAGPISSGSRSAWIRRARWLVPLVALPLAGGAALVIHVLADVSLALAAGTLLAAGAIAWAVTYRYAPEGIRRNLALRGRCGLLAGIAGTLAYDGSRYGLVALFRMSFEPFHVFLIFGRLFVGESAAPALAFAVGALYHLSNGIGFAIAFAIVVRRPTWLLGALWGVALELAMAFLYPHWLRLVALGEFLTVSAVGHVVYGSVMALALARLLEAAP